MRLKALQEVDVELEERSMFMLLLLLMLGLAREERACQLITLFGESLAATSLSCLYCSEEMRVSSSLSTP